MRLNNIDSADFYNMLDDLKHEFGEVYVTGGTVRNYMMGDPVFNDIDLAIGVDIDAVDIFLTPKPYIKSVVTVGKAFGVVRIVLKNELEVDISQFRGETYTPGSRKPEVTLVKTINEDTARRDFTFNSMVLRYLGDREFELLDLYGGLGDLQAKIVRAVGTPEDRFKEDPLRMLRAVRFAAVFGFTIEWKTLVAIRAMRAEVA